MMLLAGCVTAPVVVPECPRLAPPTLPVVDALDAVGRKDPSSAAWVIGLERHYDKLDACAAQANKARKALSKVAASAAPASAYGGGP